jgi:hypothetical protein
MKAAGSSKTLVYVYCDTQCCTGSSKTLVYVYCDTQYCIPGDDGLNRLKTKCKLLYLKTQFIPCSKHISPHTKRRLVYLKTQFIPCRKHFPPHTKRRLLYLKTESVLRSKLCIKTKQFMLYRAQVTVCSQINTKQINTVWAERTVVEC